MSEFFRKPNTVTSSFGKLKVIGNLRVVKGLEDTCAAFEKVANSEDSDSKANDYTASFEKLMNAFDSFIREFFKNFKGKECTPGKKDIYDQKSPIDLTIRLLWEIRHASTHHGGMVDDEAQKKYENILQEGIRNGLKPRLDLPDSLPLGLQFTIKKEDYYSFKNDLFSYMGRFVSKEELNILRKRSGIANVNFGPPVLTLHEEGDYYDYSVRIDDLVNNGIEIDGTEFPPAIPNNMIDRDAKRIIFLDSGVAIPAIETPHFKWSERARIKNK